MFGIEPCEGCKQRRDRIMVALTGWLKNPVPSAAKAVTTAAKSAARATTVAKRPETGLGARAKTRPAPAAPRPAPTNPALTTPRK